MKKLVDLIYRVKHTRKKFAASNAGETILAADGSKSVITDGPQPIQKGANWVTSQRAVIILTDKRIVCGKWEIPLENIAEATLVKVGSPWNRGAVLKIGTKDNVHYQFGMAYNKEWEQQVALPLRVEKGRVGYSAFSIIVRVIATGYIAYLLYRMYSRT